MKKILIPSFLLIGLIGAISFQISNKRTTNSALFHSESEPISEIATDNRSNDDYRNTLTLSEMAVPSEFKTLVEDKASENKFTRLTLAERYELAEWKASRGSSLEQAEIYRSYDQEALLALADQGDIYALQEVSGELMVNSQTSKALEALRNAAALGSVEALYMLGAIYSSTLDNLKKGHETEERIRKDFGIKQSKNFTLEKSLEIIAAAHYMASALRGDIFSAATDIDVFQKHQLKRTISKEDWPVIIKNANAVYASIDERREQLNADEFDNSYPEPYARLHELPKENNMAEKFCELLDGVC
ncbi:hypothetical protein [Agarilytica rhodophyticola]|uniref:hypothetical protein n=1 Tax=Agarilytica rhodophyticola TaxID=1737490 RepID=UPI000B343C88|nr:hypothetical protein [Agarilytica rhodophyticola]